MKDSIRAAVIQMNIRSSGAANLASIRAIVDKLSSKGSPELVVLPALANCGEIPSGSKAEVLRAADTIPGPFTQALGELAKQYGVHIVAGILERGTEHQHVYNSAVLIGPAGRLLGVQRQLHRVGSESFDKGDLIATFPSELGNVGMIVGADFLYPEVARVQALQGAEVLCVLLNKPVFPKNPSDINYYLTAARAWENKCFVLCCNRVGWAGDVQFGGRSCIVYSNGQPLALSEKEDEDILTADLLRDKLFEDRADRPAFRDRRPENYGPLAAANR